MGPARSLLLLAPLLLSCASPGAEGRPPIRVAAASSLRIVVPELVEQWRAAGGVPAIEARFDASGTLRQQVEAGAPDDLLLFAAAEPLDALVAAGAAAATSRRVVALNRLALIGAPGAPELSFRRLGELPAGRRLAVGDPAYVPVGRYARDALTELGSWQRLEEQLVYGTNVAAVLAWVGRGEADYGIVYRTDAQTRPGLRLLDEARGPWAPRPVVVAALTPAAPAGASRFLDHLDSPPARRVLRRHGFDLPDDDGS